MKYLSILFFLLITSFSRAQDGDLIHFETDTLVRKIHYPFDFILPKTFDTLLIELEGCTGRLVSDSLGMVKADSLSNNCKISIFKVIESDTILYLTKNLIIENIRQPKLLIGGLDILNMNQKKVVFDNFILGLKNVTQPRLIHINYLLYKIEFTYNGVDKTLQRTNFNKLFFNLKKGDIIILKSLFFKGPLERKMQELIINKSFTQVGFRKSKFLIEDVK